jgi:hypothetical protein
LAGDRISHHFLAGGKIGRIRVHRLGDAHRTALQQGDASSGGRKLCDSQFERHRT